MPARACIICSRPSIPGASRCPEHSRSGWDTWKAKNPHASSYSSPAWRSLRARVLKEEPVCRVCGVNPSTQVDHLLPVAEGGSFFARDNCRGICRSCHAKKSSSEGGRGKKRKGEAP